MKDNLASMFAVMFIFAMFFVVAVKCCKHDKQSNSPVRESVDSILKQNDSIKLVIIKLNEDKNEKIIEVKELDNDSTIKLFLELVKD